MRIAALATSAVLLSGCSWLGLGAPSADKSWADYNHGAQAAGRYSGGHAQYGAQAPRQGYGAPRSYGPCEITSVAQPVPQGCAPEQVTIALPGGQYGGSQAYAGNYQAPAAGSYGQSLANINRAQAAANHGIHNYWKRPRFRLTGMAGLERSVSGEAYSADNLASLYNPVLHSNQRTSGTPAEGQVIVEDYEPRINNNPVPAAAASVRNNRISDIYGAPFTLGAGAEYQVNDRFAVFGNASYTVAEGGEGSRVEYEADVHRLVTTTDYVEDPNNPGTFNAVTPVSPATNTSIPDVAVARTSATASELRRSNLELGGRYYFKDVFPQYLERPLTPYISASAGASHYNALEVSQETEELLLGALFDDPTAPTYSREGTSDPVEILEEGWVPTGAITVGAEWQITPKAALAFETGLRYEGGRSATSGGKTDDNFAIPLTLRGSIGF